MPFQLQVLADHRADDFRADHRETRLARTIAEVGLGQRVDDGARGLVEIGALFLDRVLHADQHRVVRGGAVGLHYALGGERFDRSSHRVFMDRLLELDHHRRAAGEVDAHRHPAARVGDDEAGDDDGPRDTDGVPPPLDKVEVGVLENMHNLDAQGRVLAVRQLEFKDRPRDEHRGEDVRNQPDEEGRGEATDRPGAELEQERGGNQG